EIQARRFHVERPARLRAVLDEMAVRDTQAGSVHRRNRAPGDLRGIRAEIAVGDGDLRAVPVDGSPGRRVRPVSNEGAVADRKVGRRVDQGDRAARITGVLLEFTVPDEGRGEIERDRAPLVLAERKLVQVEVDRFPSGDRALPVLLERASGEEKARVADAVDAAAGGRFAAADREPDDRAAVDPLNVEDT